MAKCQATHITSVDAFSFQPQSPLFITGSLLQVIVDLCALVTHGKPARLRCEKRNLFGNSAQAPTINKTKHVLFDIFYHISERATRTYYTHLIVCTPTNEQVTLHG
jgi:hypothetical protein